MILDWLNVEFIQNAQQIIRSKSTHYTEFKIPKKHNKFRVIEAPDDELKELQEMLLNEFLLKFLTHPIAHGFVGGRSPKTNAEVHVGAIIVIGIDLKDFFPSIKIDRVKRVLNYLWKARHCQLPYYIKMTKDELIDMFAELLTFNGRLPQGAPTSPAFSNLAVLGLDKELKALESMYGCRITRYADDVNISSDYNKMLPQIIKPIKSLIKKYGFRINNAKTRIFRQGGRMSVTGVVINVKTNIRKSTRRNLRAQLHNLSEVGEEQYSRLRGQIEWINYLNPTHGQNLLTQLHNIRKVS